MTDYNLFFYFLLTVWVYSALAMSQVLLVMFAVIYKKAEYKIPLVPHLTVVYLISTFSMAVFLPYYAYTESFESLIRKYKKLYANCSNKLKDLQ